MAANISLVVFLLVAAGWASCASVQLLDGLLDGLQKARQSMDQASLGIAEEFGREVGEGRLYKFELRLGSYNRADLAHLNSYLSGLKVLKQTGDMDAAIEVLRRAGKSDAEIEAGALQLVESVLVPACAQYVQALGPVIEAAQNSAPQLAQEVSESGKQKAVQDFIYSWAHYHTCHLLASGDRSSLISRISSRLDDQRRLAARRQTRMLRAA